MDKPLVSCIMPTANRQQFIPYAIDYFLHQNYKNLELVILDDGLQPSSVIIPAHPGIRYYYSKFPYSLGKKRNLCCQNARGEIIVHWDDDDWYAQDWVSRQVDALIDSKADITGINNVNYFLTKDNKIWKYIDESVQIPWVYGATLAYWKSFWEKNPFKEMNTGEDNDFVYHTGAKISTHNYSEGYLGLIHNDNIGINYPEDPKEKLQLSKWVKKIEQPGKSEKIETVNNTSASPLVSCIMPTANREKFIPAAIKNFLDQDYKNKELIIIDDGEIAVKYLIPDCPMIRYFYCSSSGTIGNKRNLACNHAAGEIILHFDDDDWYAPDWISRSVKALTDSGADISGIDQVQFSSPSLNSHWMTKNSNSKRPWLTGASLTYHKSFWEKHPFKDLQVGEDDDYVRNNGAKIFAHDYYRGFIATLHPKNTSLKFFEDPNTKTG